MDNNNPLDFNLDAATYISMFDAPEIVDDRHAYRLENITPPPPPVPMPAQPVQQLQQQRPVQPSVPQHQQQRPVQPSVPQNQQQRQVQPSVPQNQQQRQVQPSVPQNQQQRPVQPSIPQPQQQRPVQPLVPQHQRQRPVHPQSVSEHQQQQPVQPQSVSQAQQEPVQAVQVQSKPAGGRASGKQPKNGPSIEKKGAKIVGQPAGQGKGTGAEQVGAKAGRSIESSGEGTSKQALGTGKKRSADEKSSKLVFAQEEGKSYPEALMSVYDDATVVKKYKICGKLGPILTKWEASFEPEDPAMINNRIIASGNGISIDINLQENMFSVRAD